MSAKDELKILIAFIAAMGSNVFPIIRYMDMDERKLKYLFIIVIRIVIIYLSVKYDWPLLMCATISVIISVFSVLEIVEDEEKDKE